MDDNELEYQSEEELVESDIPQLKPEEPVISSADAFEVENVKLRKLCGMQKKKIAELEKQAGSRLEQEQKQSDFITHYRQHKKEGIELLKAITEKVKPYHTRLYAYLINQTEALLVERDVSKGIAAFKSCHKSIMKVAEYYQDVGNSVSILDKFWNSGRPNVDGLTEWLLEMDDKLCATMRIPDRQEYIGSAELSPEHKAMIEKIEEKMSSK